MKLTHNTTIMIRGKEHPSVTWEYTGNSELNDRIDTAYNDILNKYGYGKTIDKEIEKNKLDPKYGLEIVYHIEHMLYYHVKEQFMYKYGGLKKPEPTQMDRLLEQVRGTPDGTLGNNTESSEFFEPRVELYTKIVCLFQEFGGIPKVSTN